MTLIEGTNQSGRELEFVWTGVEIDDVIDIALILLSGESPDAEDIVVECIASNLENCPTAD